MATHQQDLVSVVVRTHSPKRIKLLQATLQSICANSYRPIEIVLVAQTENKIFLIELNQLIENYRQTQIFIQLVVNPTSQDERAKNLNLGIAQAQGRYLCFLDEDDLHSPNFISSLLPSLQHSPDSAWIYGDVALATCIINEYGIAQQGSVEFPFKQGRFSLDELFCGNFIPINSYLLDRDRIKSDLLIFDESFNLAEDYAFLLKLATCYQPIYAQETVSVYQVFNDLSNSTVIMNDKVGRPDKEKIKAWSHALWRIEVLKESLRPTYRPGLFSMKTRKYLYYRFPELKVLTQSLTRHLK
jgi:glycosyltransferase involved in cell wall biosynthesis